MEYLLQDCDAAYERLAEGTRHHDKDNQQQQQQQQDVEGQMPEPHDHQHQQQHTASQSQDDPPLATQPANSSGGWGFEDIDLTEPYDLDLTEAWDLGSQGLGSQQPGAPSLQGLRAGSGGVYGGLSPAFNHRRLEGSQDSFVSGGLTAANRGLGGGGFLSCWGASDPSQPEVFAWEDDDGVEGAFDLTETDLAALRATSVTIARADSAHQSGNDRLHGLPNTQQQQQQWEEDEDEEGCAKMHLLPDLLEQQQQHSDSVGVAALEEIPSSAADVEMSHDLMSHPGDPDMLTSPSTDCDKHAAAASTAAAVGTPDQQPVINGGHTAAEPAVRQGRKRPLDLQLPSATGSQDSAEGVLLPFVGQGGACSAEALQHPHPVARRRRVLADLFEQGLQDLVIDDDTSTNTVSEATRANTSGCA